MPGVPSGRACEGCRKQKKKCDEKQPTCSRCSRLGLVCVGSGQQRYKFKDGHSVLHNSGKGRQQDLSIRAKVKRKQEEVGVIITFPSNLLSSLSHAFVKAIKPSTGLRYNLVWTYGGFLQDVPRRLGMNEALDAAADALVASHSSFCVHRMISVEALTKYSLALNKIRICLDDPIKARTSETLCAIYLVLLCQGFLGTQGQRWTGHIEGAAHVLKARGYRDPQDEFESKLLLSLRGPVLFEGLFNPNISFSPTQWKRLVENELDGSTVEGQILQYLAQIPHIMQRGRSSPGEGQVEQLRVETRSLYDLFKVCLNELQIRLDTVDDFNPNEYSQRVLVAIRAHYQRSYCLGLATGIIFNCVLTVFDPENSELAAESTHFVTELVRMAEPAVAFRPLGAMYMILCLLIAWAGTSDLSLRPLIQETLDDCLRDTAPQDVQMIPPDLESMAEYLRLRRVKY